MAVVGCVRDLTPVLNLQEHGADRCETNLKVYKKKVYLNMRHLSRNSVQGQAEPWRMSLEQITGLKKGFTVNANTPRSYLKLYVM